MLLYCLKSEVFCYYYAQLQQVGCHIIGHFRSIMQRILEALKEEQCTYVSQTIINLLTAKSLKR